MRTSIIYLYILFGVFQNIQAQEQKYQDLDTEKIPKEAIYVHTNSTTFLVGEYLFYKIYNLEANSRISSDLSKVAYIALINSTGKTIIRQTVNLDSGIGTNDIFLDTAIPSGNYKLIAYTNWMENNVRNKFFSQDIFIINPYTSVQSITEEDTSRVKFYNFKNVESSEKIQLGKPQYSTREKVEVKLDLPEDGKYSISVKHLDSLPKPEMISALDYINGLKRETFSNNYPKILPELRGKLLSGYLKPTNNREQNLNKINLAFSVPGDDYFFRLGNTNAKGEFHFSIDENFVDAVGTLQVVGGRQKEDFEIVINEEKFDYSENLEFLDLKINSQMEQSILDRSINNQIENAYFSLKPDTLKSEVRKNLFHGIPKVVYNLDDYKRFSTITETFTEIVPEARVRRNGNLLEFAVLGKNPYNNFNGSPLLIVDGLYVQNVDSFIREFEAEKIKSIKIIRDKYFLSSMYFKGVILIETINANFFDSYPKKNIKEVDLTSGNFRKAYFKQIYSDKLKRSRIPDKRNQLLWDPNFEVKNNSSFEFYTSDIRGIFEISVQGFTENGKGVSLYKYFEVE